MKLYSSRIYPTSWYAYDNEAGWVMFPREANGWLKRQPARGIDPIDIREVPVRLAFDAGIPGAPNLTAEGSDFGFAEAA